VQIKFIIMFGGQHESIDPEANCFEYIFAEFKRRNYYLLQADLIAVYIGFSGISSFWGLIDI